MNKQLGLEPRSSSTMVFKLCFHTEATCTGASQDAINFPSKQSTSASVEECLLSAKHDVNYQPEVVHIFSVGSYYILYSGRVSSRSWIFSVCYNKHQSRTGQSYSKV